MKQLIVVFGLILIAFSTGCAARHNESHYEGLDGKRDRVCTHAANGSEYCREDVKNNLPPFYGYGAAGYSPGLMALSMPIQHPPVVMGAPVVMTTEAQRAMEDVPSGVAVMHPVHKVPAPPPAPQPQKKVSQKASPKPCTGCVTREEMKTVIQQVATLKKQSTK
jgi:hypothetical protein